MGDGERDREIGASFCDSESGHRVHEKRERERKVVKESGLVWEEDEDRLGVGSKTLDLEVGFIEGLNRREKKKEGQMVVREGRKTVRRTEGEFRTSAKGDGKNVSIHSKGF